MSTRNGKMVSFGELYTKNANASREGNNEDRKKKSSSQSGFFPLAADGTLADAESTLPPSSTPADPDEAPLPPPMTSSAGATPAAADLGTNSDFDDDFDKDTSPPSTDDGSFPELKPDSDVEAPPSPPQSSDDPVLPPAAATPVVEVAPEAPASEPEQDAATVPLLRTGLASEDTAAIAPPPSNPSPLAPPIAPLPSPFPGDLTPNSAEEHLRGLGVSDPKVPGANRLPDGRTVVVAQKQCLSMHEVSPQCRDALLVPGFRSAVSSARASVRSVMRDRSAAALDDLKTQLSALSSANLAACDPGMGGDLQTALTHLTLWNDAQSKLAAASATTARTQKALEAAQESANEARRDLQKQQDAAALAQQNSGVALSQQLPKLYKALKKWETLATGISLEEQQPPVQQTGDAEMPPARP